MAQRPKIFIDPGHGGRDPGATANGMRESDITLDVSRRLSEILTSAGIGNRLSRTTDIDVSINQRWQAANNWNATHFISIHVNAGAGTGVETLIPTASPSNPNRDLQANSRLAETVSRVLAGAFNMRIRRTNGVMLETETRDGSVGVLRHSRMLAIMPEIAFIDSPSNNPDVGILRNRRQEIAQALADGIFEFLGILQPQQTQTIAASQHSTVNLALTENRVAVPAENVGGHWLLDVTRHDGHVVRIRLRDLLETLGYALTWSRSTNTITATTPK